MYSTIYTHTLLYTAAREQGCTRAVLPLPRAPRVCMCRGSSGFVRSIRAACYTAPLRACVRARLCVCERLYRHVIA